MLTTKQKVYLRSLAQTMKPVFQIGYEGIGNHMLDDIRSYLNKHELMKVSLLKTAPITKEEAAETFSQCGFEIIQIIGFTLILYLKSKNAKKSIELPNK